jgi:ring-1,2-phenylacetyl-CoA epoxidase subunit PaaE
MEGAEVRRSYSICSAPHEGELRVAIKKVEGGRFSSWANGTLKPGDVLDVMPPAGRFTPRSSENKYKHYVAFAAGSGITPVISILKSVMEKEPGSRFTLIYGNRGKGSILFREGIEALKNRYMERLRVYHVLSREAMDIPLFTGRIDGDKAAEFCRQLVDINKVDEAFICGPEAMILSVRDALIRLGLPEEHVHFELFTSPDAPQVQHQRWAADHAAESGPVSTVRITLDGVTTELQLAHNGDTILDAALKAGADLPYACKGGVCSTCRAKVTEGAVEMEVNYALEKDEVKNGFVLTCQSHPTTPVVSIDFDAR